MAYIDALTKQRIIDIANIKEVVEDYVPLRRSGVNYIGLCPFHDDKHPSFFVSPTKNICHCFVCGQGGNPVNFLMKKENLTYGEALRELAKKYHIEIEEKELTPEEKQRNDERASLMTVNEWLNNHFIDNLHNTKEGQDIGMSYLLQRRELRQDIIAKFQLGYAMREADEYTKAAKTNGYKVEFLRTLGATIHNDERNSDYDRFRGRVIFPIHSMSGKVIAFGGRTLNPNDNAKYQNSPESDIYQKRLAVYGLYFAKKAIQQEKKCYISEGYCDVISMVQAGVENIIAPCGTALTSEQAQLLKKIIPSVSPNDDEDKHVTMMYDGDAAGIHAGMKNGPILLEQGLRVHIVLLPEEDDPDTFAHKHSSEEVKAYLKDNEQDFILYYARQFVPSIQNDPIKKSEAIVDTAAVIANIPDKLRRSVYVQECSNILNVEESLLAEKTNELRKKKKDEELKKQQLTENRQFQPRNPSQSQQTQTGTGTANAGQTTAPAAPQQQGADDVPDEYYAQLSGNEETHQAQGQIKPTPRKTEFVIRNDDYEKSIIHMLIKYGNQKLFNIKGEDNKIRVMNVGEYIIKQMEEDDLDLKDEKYRLIKNELLEKSKGQNFDAERYFLNHIENDISQLMNEIMFDKALPNDEELFDPSHDAPNLMMNWKIDLVKKKEQGIRTKLSQSVEFGDNEKLLMDEMIQLDKVKEKLGTILSRVSD